MKKYETMFIIDPDVTEEQLNLTIDKVKALIEKENGEIENVELQGKKKLAYEINKKNDGFFVLINFRSNEKFPEELYRNFKISDFIIRSIVVKK